MSSEANNDTADAPTSALPKQEPSPSVDVAPAPAVDAPLQQTSNAALPSVIVDPSLESGPASPLPSVIVDPTASAAPVAEAAAAPSASDASDGGGQDDDDAAWSAGTFSDHDADRFADSMRPSWDMPTADTEGSWSTAQVAAMPHAASQVPTGRAVAASNDSDGLPPLVIARGIDKRMVMAGVGGLLLIVLALWSMIDHEPEVPPSWNGTSPTAPVKSSAAPPSTTTASAAKTPAPAVEPTPTVPATPASTAPAVVAPVPPAPAVAAVAPTPEPRAPAATPIVPATPKTVHVRISTTPASAELKLDGERVPNPFDAWVTRGGTHNVVADAEGYAQREWSIAFDQDQTLSLVLKREETKRPARRTRRAQQRTTQSKSRPRGAGFVTDNPY